MTPHPAVAWTARGGWLAAGVTAAWACGSPARGAPTVNAQRAHAAVAANGARPADSAAVLHTVVGRTRVVVRADLLLIVGRGDRSGSVSVAPLTGADSAVRVSLVDARGVGARYYVLLYVDGAERGAASGGRGCAPEAGLVWVAFDADLGARKTQGVRTASCRGLLRQADPDVGPPPVFKDMVNVAYDELPGGRRHDVWYAVRHPERGVHDAVAREPRRGPGTSALVRRA